MTIDVVRAESSRFRHPLLMIHGLWTGAWIWRQFSGYLAHRGWDAFVPSFLAEGRAPAARDRLQLLRELSQTWSAPPVIVAHDAGVATAVALARAIGAPALVAITPLTLDARPGVFRHPQFLLARIMAARVRPPRGGTARVLLEGLGDGTDLLRPDSGPFFRHVLSGRAGLGNDEARPGLVLCSRNDAVTTVSAAEVMARRYGWSFDVHETVGHFPMLAPGWEDLADRVHRWLVRAIGADLLTWLDDEDEPE
jgi:predicted alpha/beta hydrolase family esterase